MNFFTTGILALVCFYALLIIIVFFFQRNLLYHPSIDNYLKNNEGNNTYILLNSQWRNFNINDDEIH